LERAIVDERRLWAGVLVQAIRDCVGYIAAPNKRERARVQYFARLWFADDNREVGSFLWVCDQLELEPSWIRRRMAAQIHSDQVAKDGAGRISLLRLQGRFKGEERYTASCVRDLLSA
jgi:hypothetical protein